jgi:hypothetical protein
LFFSFNCSFLSFSFLPTVQSSLCSFLSSFQSSPVLSCSLASPRVFFPVYYSVLFYSFLFSVQSFHVLSCSLFSPLLFFVHCSSLSCSCLSPV